MPRWFSSSLRFPRCRNGWWYASLPVDDGCWILVRPVFFRQTVERNIRQSLWNKHCHARRWVVFFSLKCKVSNQKMSFREDEGFIRPFRNDFYLLSTFVSIGKERRNFFFLRRAWGCGGRRFFLRHVLAGWEKKKFFFGSKSDTQNFHLIPL